MKLYDEISSKEKYDRLNHVMTSDYVSPEKVDLKINFIGVLQYLHCECYREMMVSYYPMLPLLELPQVPIEYADYIVYMHPYARCEDVSEIALKDLKYIDNIRNEGAEIIVVGKAANVEKLLNGSLSNITFWGDHFTEKLGKKFGINMSEKYFVYDEDLEHLAIWPVDGCMQQCKFCRRSYMHIRFESLSLDVIKENLDSIRKKHPEWLKRISLRAENLTEYGIDIYGKPMLPELLDLINSYDEVEIIDFPIGLSIGEITPEILDALCRFKHIDEIALNLEAGSNRLLKLIGKKHTREDAIYIYGKIREAHPNAWLTSTVMIGLPTEGITDIFELADLIGQVGVDGLNCNYYILASKHPLAKLPQISASLRDYHLKILLKALRTSLRHELKIVCWKVPKNKYSRKYIRDKKQIEEENKTASFPSHLCSTFVYTEISG